MFVAPIPVDTSKALHPICIQLPDRAQFVTAAICRTLLTTCPALTLTCINFADAPNSFHAYQHVDTAMKIRLVQLATTLDAGASARHCCRRPLLFAAAVAKGGHAGVGLIPPATCTRAVQRDAGR
jgi:hypothetical protein